MFKPPIPSNCGRKTIGSAIITAQANADQDLQNPDPVVEGLDQSCFLKSSYQLK
jgi:hypothetical protein